MRLSLLLLFACGADGGDTAAETDAPEDTAADSAAPVDTGLALVHYEGSATIGAETWDGTEAWIARSRDGSVEHCRVENALTGVLSAVEPCPGCSFAFDVTVGAGTATGERCAHVRFTAEMWEGTTWLYAYAPEYVYGPYGYVYRDVLLYGYTVGETTRWQMTAHATLEEDRLLYEALYADLWTYYAL